METNKRLTDDEYEVLSLKYEQNPPALSSKPGFITNMRESRLVSELLSPDYARIVNTKAKVMLLSPAEVIQYAIKAQLGDS